MESPETKAEYEQFIETFTFRGADGIKIPKNVRKLAYSMAIDLVIVSSARIPFYDYNCTPPKSFYGKATLVKENFLDEPIDVTMPRQRLYYGRVDEAFRHWQTLVDFDYHRYYYDLLPRFFIGLIEGLKGIPLLSAFVLIFDLVLSILEIECLSLPDMPWLELPLREVYFNPLPRTQYKIEISYYSPVPFTDGCGNERTGESFQEDGEKDEGLPDDGIMPDIPDDPDDPFAGLPPASSENEQGDFANDKSSSAGNVDPDNVAAPPLPIYRPGTYSVTATASFSNNATSNNVPVTSNGISLGQSIPPFVPQFSAPSGIVTVIIVDSQGRQVQGMACFGAGFCSRFGVDGVEVSWELIG